MLYAVTWSIKPEHVRAVQASFKQTGALPTAGVKLLGRWHGVSTSKGFCVAETNDPVALSRFLNQWTHLMSFDVYPVVTDEDAAKILS